jgi:hypothetical protein
MVLSNTKDFPNGICEIIEHNQDACFSLGLNNLLQIWTLKSSICNNL